MIKISRQCFAALFLLGPALGASLICTAAGDQALGPAAEELIAEKDPSCPVFDDEDVASADGRKVAWRARAGQKWSVMMNGERHGGTFDEVRSLTFSSGSHRFAFAARRDKRWMLVLDGNESPVTYEDVGAPVFSSDGAHVAYGARRGKRWVIVEDGRESAASYAAVRLPEYSDDGTQMSFAAKREKKWALMVNGEPRGGEFDEIVAGGFSPDGRRVQYVGRRGNKFITVVDEKEGPSFDIVGGLRFSADSRRFAYAGVNVDRGFAKEKGIGRTMVDGVPGPEFEGAQIGSLLKSMVTQSIPHLVVGYFGQLLSGTHGVTAPVFSPDGRRFAYAARRSKDATTVFVDGSEGPAFPSILAGPVFSPDSQRVAIVAAGAGTTSLVIDGTRVGEASAIETGFIAHLLFAPDNQRVAYVGVTGGDWYERGFTQRARRRVYVDGVPGSEYDAKFAARLQFTADSRHLVYVVGGLSDGSRDVAFVVVDAAEGKRYDEIFGTVRIDPDARTINYTAQAGRRFLRVTQPIIRPPTTS